MFFKGEKVNPLNTVANDYIYSKQKNADLDL